MSDATRQLVQHATQGDRPAIDQLLERYLPGLRAFIRMRAGPMIRRRESESDLAQSVCREVLEHLDQFQYGDEVGFKRWLYTTALRKILHRYESGTRRSATRSAMPARNCRSTRLRSSTASSKRRTGRSRRRASMR
jgi:DNA-directed RNA polymerase specialized sigma24 family protein